MANQMERRGLPFLELCLLCDQEGETAQYILTTCVFARQFWYNLLAPQGLADLVPELEEISFAD